MNSNLTYDDYLQRINIQTLLQDAGYALNKRDGLRYPSYVRFDSNGSRIRGDKFIVSANGKCCFQPPQQKLYNVISFIKSFPHLFSDYNAGMSPDQLVNRVCGRLLNCPVKESRATYLQPQRSAKPFDINNYSILHFDPKESETHKRFFPFFKSRKIDLYTQFAFHRHIMLASRELPNGKVLTNLAFPLTLPKDKERTIVGLEERGCPRADGSSGYKGKAEGSNSSEGIWIANLTGKPLEKVDRVLWFESAFDAMSYYQLARKNGELTKGVYVSTGGNPTEKQIKGMLEAAPNALHHLCFDNDPAGRAFAANFAYNPPMEWREYVASLHNPQSLTSGNEDLLPDSVGKLYGKAETLEIEYLSSKSSGLVCKEDLEQIRQEAIEAKNEYSCALTTALPMRGKVVFDFAPEGSKDWNEALVRSESAQEQNTNNGFHR